MNLDSGGSELAAAGGEAAGSSGGDAVFDGEGGWSLGMVSEGA